MENVCFYKYLKNSNINVNIVKNGDVVKRGMNLDSWSGQRTTPLI